MRLNPFAKSNPKAPVLLAVTPPRTGERTLLGVENLLQPIAVPEPFSLELAGDGDGVTLLARCRDGEVVRGQIAAHYPQARIEELSEEGDPLRLAEGEQAWGLTLTSSGPDYVPLRTFRDDDPRPRIGPAHRAVGRARRPLRENGWSHDSCSATARSPTLKVTSASAAAQPASWSACATLA